jgi:hypothetical protein
MTDKQETNHAFARSLSNAGLGDVSKNPKRGDKVSNRKQPKHQTRQVEDRTLYGDVIYFYDVRAGYEAQCTLAEWKVFCAGATLLKASPNVKLTGCPTTKGVTEK